VRRNLLSGGFLHPKVDCNPSRRYSCYNLSSISIWLSPCWQPRGLRRLYDLRYLERFRRLYRLRLGRLLRGDWRYEARGGGMVRWQGLRILRAICDNLCRSVILMDDHAFGNDMR
jgi:hypothetical protein